MGRRNFLLATFSAVSAGLAGCSALGGAENAKGTYEPSAADNLAVAVGQLNKAALALDEFQNQDDGETNSDEDRRRTFDASEPRERVAAAREALSRAEDGGAEQADVRAVRQYADGVGGMVDAVANVTTASNRLAAVEDDFDGDEVDTDAASATLSEATDASAASQTAHDDAETALASADRDRLRAVDAQYDAVNSGLESLLSYIVGVDGLAVGYDTYVGGIDSLQAAQDQVDAEQFDAARGSFSGAQTAFTDAASAFTGAIDGAAEDLESDLTEGDERSRALDRLSAGYVSLLDSRDHVTSAESAIDEGEDDAARTDLTAGSDDATTASDRFDDGATIREAEFTEEFTTAQDRASAMGALPEGYLSVLDARAHLDRAEAEFEEGDSGTIQSSLDAASADATTADEAFASGQGLAPDLFGDALSTGRERATAMDSLAVGYSDLVDGRDRLEDGEAAFVDEDYDRAATAFSDADDAAGRAETTFSDGEPADGGGLFDAEFADAFRRASVLGSLGEGYELVVQGRQTADGARRDLRAGNFAAAERQFRAAGETFAEAETVFADGRAAAGEEFGPELDRALCRTGHLQNAMDHFVAAAEAGADGDRRTLDQERTAGQADVDRLGEC